MKTIHKIKHEGGRQNPILDFDTRHLRCDVGQSVCERSNFEHSPPLFIFCFRYLSTGKALFENVQRVVAASTVASAHHKDHHPYAQSHEKEHYQRTEHPWDVPIIIVPPPHGRLHKLKSQQACVDDRRSALSYINDFKEN